MRTLATLLLVACADSAKPEPHWNVLLISVDTLRADHLSCYGYDKPTSPNLDRLASEGLRFSQVESPRAKTTPALCSLFTGLYPHEHGVRDLASPLDAKFPLLAESFSRAGYRTGAIVGNWVLGAKRSGLQRGFDVWVEEFPDVRGVPPHDAPQRTAKSLTDGAFEMLALGDASKNIDAKKTVIDGAKPWFVWLHYMDPHGAYEPPKEHRIFHSPRSPIPAMSDEWKAGHKQHIADYNVPPEARDANGIIDAAVVRDLYDGEIHYVDSEIGRLLDALRAKGELEHTLVVFTADHGESLGEQDYWFEHGMYAYESTSHVPLIVRFPDRCDRKPPSGVRDGLVSLTDVAPTLLDWFDLPPLFKPDPMIVRGWSRAPLFAKDDLSAHAVFYEKVERSDLNGAVQTKSARVGNFKWVERFAAHEKKDAGTTTNEMRFIGNEVYDLSESPLEAHTSENLGDDHGGVRRRAKSALDAFVAADVNFAQAGELLRRQREALEKNDPKTAEELKKLGYY